MTQPSESQSISEIKRADRILLIRLESVRLGPWRTIEGERMQRGHASLKIVVEKKLKGKPLNQGKKPFSFKTEILGSEDGMVFGYCGVWGHVPLSKGTRLAAFCHGDSRDARALLREPQCELLLEADHALPDIQAAMEVDKKKLKTAALLEEARAQAESRRDIFARYLWASVEEEALAKPETFAAAVALLLEPKTVEIARDTYLGCIYESLALKAEPIGDCEIALIGAMFQLLNKAFASKLHRAIGTVYLPNILGLSANRKKYRPKDIFATASAKAAITRAAGLINPDLKTWLDQG